MMGARCTGRRVEADRVYDTVIYLATRCSESRTHGEGKQTPQLAKKVYAVPMFYKCLFDGLSKWRWVFATGTSVVSALSEKDRAACGPHVNTEGDGGPITADSPSPGACGTNAGAPPPARRPAAAASLDDALNQVVAGGPEHRT